MPRPIEVDELIAIARKHKLVWPPPRDLEKLKQLYRTALLEHHPDKGGCVEAAREINFWFECCKGLLDGRLKRVRQPIAPQPVPTSGFWSVTYNSSATTANVATGANFPFGGNVVVIFRRG